MLHRLELEPQWAESRKSAHKLCQQSREKMLQLMCHQSSGSAWHVCPADQVVACVVCGYRLTPSPNMSSVHVPETLHCGGLHSGFSQFSNCWHSYLTQPSYPQPDKADSVSASPIKRICLRIIFERQMRCHLD